MIKDLVKLVEWEKWRYSLMTTPQNTPLRLLTKEGAAARELLSEFLGCTPKYILASYRGIYFKWEKTNKKFDHKSARIVGDVLLDKDYEAKIEDTPKYLRISFGHATPITKEDRRTPKNYKIVAAHDAENYLVWLYSERGRWLSTVPASVFLRRERRTPEQMVKNPELLKKIVRDLKKRGLIPS